MEKQNDQQGDTADLSQWLEEVEPEDDQEIAQETTVQKRPSEPLVQKIEKEQNIFTPPKMDKPLSTLTTPPPPPTQEYRAVHKQSPQSTDNEYVKKHRQKKRHSLNYKNKKTLRQAFILNTVLSKAKAYEP